MILLIWVFFALVLVEVQFLGYKFGLKGLTYTRENMVSDLFTPVKFNELQDPKQTETAVHMRPNKKICVSGYMLLKIRVGRSDNFFIF